MLIKPNLLIYVRRDNLIVGGPKLSPANLKLTGEVLVNLEILDESRYVEVVSDFFKAHEISSKRALIVLDPSTVFKKSISLESRDKKAVSKLIQEYKDLIPYPVGKRALVRVDEVEKINLYATNSQLYLCLFEALKSAGTRKVLSVTPADLYDLNYGLKANEFIEQFLVDKQARKLADFLETDPF